MNTRPRQHPQALLAGDGLAVVGQFKLLAGADILAERVTCLVGHVLFVHVYNVHESGKSGNGTIVHALSRALDATVCDLSYS